MPRGVHSIMRMAADRFSCAYSTLFERRVRLLDPCVAVLNALGMLRLVTSRALVFAAVLLSPISDRIPQLGSGYAQPTEIKSLLENQIQDQHLAGIAAIVIRSNTI